MADNKSDWDERHWMISIIRTPTIIIMLVANYLKLVKLCIGYVQ